MRKLILLYISLAFLVLTAVSPTSGLSISASTGGSNGASSTTVTYGATIDDYAYQDLKLNPQEGTLSNAFSGSGNLPYAKITKTDGKGSSATAYRYVKGVSGYTTWNYDWGTYSPYCPVCGYGAGVWLRFNVYNANYLKGCSYGSNSQGDYAKTFIYVEGGSPYYSYGATLKNMYTKTEAFKGHVYSQISADYVKGTILWADADSCNTRNGVVASHWIDGYGTDSRPLVANYPYLKSGARDTYADAYGETTGASGTNVRFRTHVENKAAAVGKEGTYYTGGGDFGVNIKNYGTLKGSVLGTATTSQVSLSPSTNVPFSKTAYLLDPYRAEWVGKHDWADWGMDAFNALMNRGYAVTYYRDSAVSHARVGDMDNYYISSISTYANPDALYVTRAADSDRKVTGSELASMFTKNPQGLIYLGGSRTFYPNANSPLANAVKNKEWLSGGYTYSIPSGEAANLFESKFYRYLTATGYSVRTASKRATEEVWVELGETIAPTWTPSTRDFRLS